MPWFVWLIVSGAATALLGPPPAWAPGPAHSRGEYEQVQPYTWTSAPWFAVADRHGWCNVVVFGVTGGGRRMRLRVDGQEQVLDSAWTVDVRVSEYVRRFVTFQYLDPIGGREVACHQVEVACLRESEPEIVAVSRGPDCAESVKGQ